MPTFQIEPMFEQPIGYLIVQGDIRVAIYKPIKRFHRLMLKLCFGWTYEPYQKGGTNEK